MKTITGRCDGEGCSERVETPCEPQTTEVYLPGWLRRRVVDEWTDHDDQTAERDCFLHYCPQCIDTVRPPLPAGLAQRRAVLQQRTAQKAERLAEQRSAARYPLE